MVHVALELLSHTTANGSQPHDRLHDPCHGESSSLVAPGANVALVFHMMTHDDPDAFEAAGKQVNPGAFVVDLVALSPGNLGAQQRLERRIKRRVKSCLLYTSPSPRD